MPMLAARWQTSPCRRSPRRVGHILMLSLSIALVVSFVMTGLIIRLSGSGRRHWDGDLLDRKSVV